MMVKTTSKLVVEMRHQSQTILFDRAPERARARDQSGTDRSSSLRKGDITGPLAFALELEADLGQDQDKSSDDGGEEDGTVAN